MGFGLDGERLYPGMGFNLGCKYLSPGTGLLQVRNWLTEPSGRDSLKNGSAF